MVPSIARTDQPVSIAGAAYTYALGGFTTVIDGIVGPWTLDHFRTRAAQHPELAVHYVVLRPQRDITMKRAQSRTAPNALIDEGPILTMWDQFSDLGELENHVLDTSDEPEERSAQRVASMAAGFSCLLRREVTTSVQSWITQDRFLATMSNRPQLANGHRSGAQSGPEQRMSTTS